MTEGQGPSFRIRLIDSSRNLELKRRAELRRNYLVPIYFMHTSDVPQREARAALQGVVDVLSASGQERQIFDFGSKPFGRGDFSSPDWYIIEAARRQSLRKSAGYGSQIDTDAIRQLFHEEPFQENPHWEVFVINQDLTATGRDGNYLNYIYGDTDRHFASSVQSVTRIMAEIKEGALRDAFIRRLLRHEVGHMFGLIQPGRQNTEYNLGTHCVNICSMRQGKNLNEWVELTKEEHNKGVHFCSDCMHDLAVVRSKYKPLPPHR